MEIIRHITKKIIILIMALLIGLLALMAVYLIPTGRIRENIGRGADILLEQGPTYQYAEGYRSAIFDNETDAIMLGEVMYASGSPVQDAVMVPRLEFATAESNVYSLMGAIHGDDNPGISTYPRYWHGYLVLLKPFFIFFDYSDFRIMNQAVQLILLCIVIVLFVKRGLVNYLWAFIPAMILWNPATMGVSLQYSACYYIAMGGMIIVLARESFEISQMMNVFFVLGICVAYFDFLTYPIATLGMPLITMLVLEISKQKLKISDGIKAVCGSSFNWGAGYVLFWALKWIVGSMLTGTSIIADAFGQIGNRVSSQVDGETITRFGALIRIINVSFAKWPYILMIAIVMIFVAASAGVKFGNGVSNRDDIIPMLCSMAIVAIIPFIWIIVTANHSYIHPRLVYRSMGVTLYAVLTVWATIFAKEKC